MSGSRCAYPLSPTACCTNLSAWRCSFHNRSILLKIKNLSASFISPGACFSTISYRIKNTLNQPKTTAFVILYTNVKKDFEINWTYSFLQVCIAATSTEIILQSLITWSLAFQQIWSEVVQQITVPKRREVLELKQPRVAIISVRWFLKIYIYNSYCWTFAMSFSRSQLSFGVSGPIFAY